MEMQQMNLLGGESNATLTDDQVVQIKSDICVALVSIIGIDEPDIIAE